MMNFSTSHEGNDGENYKENLEENFEDDFEENFKKTFEQNVEENFEDNLEDKFEEPYFEENLKLNRRYQISSEKDDDDHNDDNRPPPELPPPNSKSNRQILMNRNIVECRDQLTMRKDKYAYFVTTNETPRDNGSRTLEKRETSPEFKNLQKGLAKEIKKGNY